MIFYIKNMVCNRCIMIVNQQMEKLNLHPLHVKLGEIEFIEVPTQQDINRLSDSLCELGFELLDDRKQKLIEQIKNHLIKKVQSGEVEEHFSITDYLSKALKKDYSNMSRLFTEVESITIEQFFILQKIEKVKELLVYGQFNLNEISYQFGYSSVAHLSSQFKKVTGLTPSHFKKFGNQMRHSLDAVPYK